FHVPPSGGANVVPDAIVLSGGPGSVTEEGGFYNFGGGWAPQRNAGRRGLTTGGDPGSENASRLQAVRLGPGSILVLWEVWSRNQYQETRFMVVDDLGQVLTAARALDTAPTLRLSRTDDPVTIGDLSYVVSGSGHQLEVVSFGLR